MRILGLARGGVRTPLDGRWVVEYDPTRPGVDHNGRSMPVHLVTTDDRSQAARFPNQAAAHAEWVKPSGRPWPLNAPLTAWTVSIAPLDQSDDDDPIFAAVIATARRRKQ